MRISDWSSDVCSSDLTVDWLLEMVRFADGALLEEVAARGELDDRLVTKLADQIKAFHNDAEQYRAQSGRDHIAAVISGNRASMARFGEILPADRKSTRLNSSH